MDPTPGFNRLFSLFSCTNKSKVNPDIDSYLHDMYFSILWFATQENKEGLKKKKKGKSGRLFKDGRCQEPDSVRLPDLA